MYFSLIFITTFSLLSAARIYRPDERIVGGSQVPIEAAPWQVALLEDGNQCCGGSILNEWVILTAAHCVEPRIIEKLTVRAGSSDWSSGGQEVGVAMKKHHEYYRRGEDPYDIAVIFLAARLELGQSVKPIPLAEITPEAGTFALVTGWGHTKNIYEGTRYLRGANVFIQDHLECTLVLSKGNASVTEDNLCASAPGRDACQLDSGGPLVDVNKGDLIGVVSWGLDCADPSYPGVYADVAYFKDWIRQVVSNLVIENILISGQVKK